MDTLKVILLRGIRDGWIGVFNLMGKGDISHLTYLEICNLCKRPRDSISRVNKSATSGVSRVDISNLLDNFKIDILNTLGSQLDTLKIKQKKEEENVALTIFRPKCRKGHPLREFLLDNIELCGICAENHTTNNFSSLPELKSVYQGNQEAREKLCFVAPKRP